MRRLLFLTAGCLMAVLLSSSSGCKGKQDAAQEPVSETVTPPTPEPEPVMEQPLQAPVPDPNPKNARVRVTTKFGDMIVRLYDETPAHRDNFLMLVERGFYNDLLFHRCIRNFMAQGGDPQSRGASQNQQLGMGGPGYTIPAEFNNQLLHKKGALSAARQGDQVNPERRSSGSQFYIVQGQKYNDAQLNQYEAYINQKTPGFRYTAEQRAMYQQVGGTPMLDMDYTVFGEVIEGLNIIDSILMQPTRPGDRPVEDIIMRMEVIK